MTATATALSAALHHPPPLACTACQLRAMHALKPGNLPDWPPPQPEGGPEPVSPPTAASTSSGSDDTAIAAPVEGTAAQPHDTQQQHAQPQGLRSFDFGSWSPLDANSPASYRPPPGLASPAFPQFDPPQQPHQHQHPPPPHHRQQHPFTSYQAEPLPIEQPSSWPSPGFCSAERQSLQHANNGYHGVSLSMLEMGGHPSASSASQQQPRSVAPRSSSGAAANSFGLPSSAPNSSSFMLVDEPAPVYDPWRPTASTSTHHQHQPPPPPPQHLHSPDPSTTSPRAPKRSRNESDTSASSISALNALTSGGALGEYPLFGGQVFGGLAQHDAAAAAWQPQPGDGAAALHRADRSLSGASGSGSGSGSGTGSGSGSGENGSASGGVASSRTSLSVGNGGGDGGSRPGKGGASASGLAASAGAAAVDDKKIVQRADKSCKKCRCVQSHSSLSPCRPRR